MLATVIMTTYNAPEWLEKVLWGFAAQIDQRFEVVIADDGSQPATLELLRRMASELPFALRHVWQPDDGFRKCQKP